MSEALSPFRTSARLLVDHARQFWGDQADAAHQRRYLIVCDLYIKARSYALINKVAFWLSVFAGLAVLIWPSIAVVSEGALFKSAVVQTTVTGLAALAFAVYNHYKKRQVSVENLMRHIVYSDESAEALIPDVLREMERIDAGFSFSESITKKDKAGG